METGLYLKITLLEKANCYQLTDIKATLCNFNHDPWFQKMKLSNAYWYVAQNSGFSRTRSYFTEKISSGSSPDVLRLLCLNSVIHGSSWKQHVGNLQTKAAAAAAGRWWWQLR